MRRAGQVVRTVNGMILVRSANSEHLPVGQTLIDEALRPVGMVVDIFGPRSTPYLLVTPVNDQGVAGLLNEKLYVT